MPIDYDLLMSRRLDDRELGYTDTQMLLYNIGIGMGRDPFDENELPYVFERPLLRVVPTAATILSGASSTILDGIAIDHSRVVHGEQRLIAYRPMPPSSRVIGHSRVTEVVDKGEGRGAIITTTTEGVLADGQKLFTAENVIFARADGGFGGPAKSRAVPHSLPTRDPDMVHVTQTRPDQALLYRLNGDRNPLHAEPDFARRAGFPRPILHGMCSYGIACRAVLASVCAYDPAAIRSFDARFTAPVFPGETIHTDIWVDGTTVSFRSRIEARGITSINNGRCTIG